MTARADYCFQNDNSNHALGGPAIFDRLGAVFDRFAAVFDRFGATFDRFGTVFHRLGALSIENSAETKHLNSTRTAKPPKGPGSSNRIQMLKSSLKKYKSLSQRRVTG